MEVASGIIGVAAIGVKLSTTLYTFASSVANADKDMTDIAGDVALTSNVLNNVGVFLQEPETIAITSGTAVSDANSILCRCKDAFTEIEAMVNGENIDGSVGGPRKKAKKRAKFSWPLKSSRLELLKRRLESLKSSLMLLLQVLSFARGKAAGKLTGQALADEQESITNLHQQHQEALARVASLEKSMAGVFLDDITYELPTASTGETEMGPVSNSSSSCASESAASAPAIPWSATTPGTTAFVSLAASAELQHSDDLGLDLQQLIQLAANTDRLLKSIRDAQAEMIAGKLTSRSAGRQISFEHRKFNDTTQDILNVLPKKSSRTSTLYYPRPSTEEMSRPCGINLPPRSPPRLRNFKAFRAWHQDAIHPPQPESSQSHNDGERTELFDRATDLCTLSIPPPLPGTEHDRTLEHSRQTTKSATETLNKKEENRPNSCSFSSWSSNLDVVPSSPKSNDLNVESCGLKTPEQDGAPTRLQLTKNQRTYLFGVFARNAHPDSAYCLQIAQEIPGATTLQIQNWFKNRRAKLTRLTSHDHERMTRSRALPDDFDMKAALHAPYGDVLGPSRRPTFGGFDFTPPLSRMPLHTTRNAESLIFRPLGAPSDQQLSTPSKAPVRTGPQVEQPSDVNANPNGHAAYPRAVHFRSHSLPAFLEQPAFDHGYDQYDLPSGKLPAEKITGLGSAPMTMATSRPDDPKIDNTKFEVERGNDLVLEHVAHAPMKRKREDSPNDIVTELLARWTNS